MQVNKYKFYEQFKLGDSRINRAESIVDRSVKTSINNPFGLNLSKAGIGAGLAIRLAHRER